MYPFKFTLLIAALFVMFVSCSKKDNNTSPVEEIANTTTQITSFRIDSCKGVIDIINHTITVKVPYSMDPTKLVASLVLAGNSTVVPASNTAQDFTSPVVYTVTAKNGQKQTWTVTVEQIDGIQAFFETFTATIGSEMYSNNKFDTVANIIKLGFDKRRLGDFFSNITIKYDVPDFIKVSPASGTIVDLSKPVTFTITDEKGNKTTYTAKVYNTAGSFNFTVPILPPYNESLLTSGYTQNNHDHYDSTYVAGLGENIALFAVYESIDVSALPLTITNLSEGASVYPDPSIPQNFNNDINYNVITEIGDTITYTVRCIKMKVLTYYAPSYNVISGLRESGNSFSYQAASKVVAMSLISRKDGREYPVTIINSYFSNYGRITFQADLTTLPEETFTIKVKLEDGSVVAIKELYGVYR